MSGAGRVLAGATILGVVVGLVGARPVLDGLDALSVRVLLLGVLVAAVSTAACAVRWRLVAGELGVPLRLPVAVAACYRAQLLNTLLPAGVLGDVDRGLAHGRASGRTGVALRAVAWERTAGQVVQAAVTGLVLVLVPSPWGDLLPAALVVVLVVVAGVALVALAPRVRRELRVALAVRRVWPGVVVASVVALACHVTTYVLVARAVGVSAPTATLVPLALVVLLAAGLPLNVAGWGPREGMAVWASSAAGLGASAGLATSVAYGAVVLVANLPGLAVLAAHGTAAVRTPVRSGGGSRA